MIDERKDIISNQYNFSDFTTENYKNLLKITKGKFEFVFFNETESKSKYVLWRHDIDFSVNRALRLAEIENELGVKSTFFVHLHNEFYNPFELKITCLLKNIIELGHKIGLHFDTHYYSITNQNKLDEKIKVEAEILKNIILQDIDVFSFHNTSTFTMNCKMFRYGGLINTYADYFQSNVEYCSDSNGYWRFKRLENFLIETTNTKIQVLTHPEWWQDEIMSPWQRINRCIDGRAINCKNDYKDYLKKLGMKNIDWNGDVE